MTPVSGALKTISTATAANLVGRAANVLIGLSVITYCGANMLTDRFFFVMAIGLFFFGVLSNAITTATTPLLISEKVAFTSKHSLYSGVIVTALLWSSSLLWNLFSIELSPAYALAIGLMSGAGIANGFATGIHHAGDSYRIPGVTWSIRLIPLVLFIVAGAPEERLAWLALGVGLCDWLRFAVLWRTSRPFGVDAASFISGSFLRAFPTFGKIIAASVIMGLNPIIDRMIAQLSGPGAISVLEAGDRIYMTIASISTIGMSAVLLTHLSRQAGDQELDANWLQTIRLCGLWIGVWVLIGIVAGFWGLAWWLNNFTPLSAADIQSSQWVYWYYLIGLPPFAIGLTYVKRLQALHRWWVMVGTSTLSVAINIPASLVLRQWMGIPGIALATTLISFLNCGVLIFAAHTKRDLTGI